MLTFNLWHKIEHFLIQPPLRYWEFAFFLICSCHKPFLNIIQFIHTIIHILIINSSHRCSSLYVLQNMCAMNCQPWDIVSIELWPGNVQNSVHTIHSQRIKQKQKTRCPKIEHFLFFTNIVGLNFQHFYKKWLITML